MAKLFAYLCSVHIELSVASSKCSCLLSPDLLQFCESSPGKLEDRAQGPTNALSGQLEKFSRKSQLSRRCNSRFSGHIKPTWCLSQYLNVCCKYLMPNWIIHSVAVAHCLATPPSPFRLATPRIRFPFRSSNELIWINLKFCWVCLCQHLVCLSPIAILLAVLDLSAAAASVSTFPPVGVADGRWNVGGWIARRGIDLAWHTLRRIMRRNARIVQISGARLHLLGTHQYLHFN